MLVVRLLFGNLERARRLAIGPFIDWCINRGVQNTIEIEWQDDTIEGPDIGNMRLFVPPFGRDSMSCQPCDDDGSASVDIPFTVTTSVSFIESHSFVAHRHEVDILVAHRNIVARVLVGFIGGKHKLFQAPFVCNFFKEALIAELGLNVCPLLVQ